MRGSSEDCGTPASISPVQSFKELLPGANTGPVLSVSSSSRDSGNFDFYLNSPGSKMLASHSNSFKYSVGQTKYIGGQMSCDRDFLLQGLWWDGVCAH